MCTGQIKIKIHRHPFLFHPLSWYPLNISSLGLISRKGPLKTSMEMKEIYKKTVEEGHKEDLHVHNSRDKGVDLSLCT